MQVCCLPLSTFCVEVSDLRCCLGRHFCVPGKSTANVRRMLSGPTCWLSRMDRLIMTPKPVVWVLRWIIFKLVMFFIGCILWLYPIQGLFIIYASDSDVTNSLIVSELLNGSQKISNLLSFYFVKVVSGTTFFIFYSIADVPKSWDICRYSSIEILDHWNLLTDKVSHYSTMILLGFFPSIHLCLQILVLSILTDTLSKD